MFTSVLSVFGDVLAPRPNKRKEIWAFLRGGQYDKAVVALREPNHGFVATEKDTKSGLTALHIAAAAGKLDLMIELIVQGADVNCVDDAGNSVLHFATQNDQRSAVEVLLRYGASANVINKNGLYPVEMTKNPAVTELFQRDKHNIFSPVVLTRPPSSVANDPELMSEKILGSDLLGDLNEAMDRVHIEDMRGGQKEEFTIVGVTSATKKKQQQKGSVGQNVLYPIMDTSRDDDYDQNSTVSHEDSGDLTPRSSSPKLSAANLPPPPVTPPHRKPYGGSATINTISSTAPVPPQSVNHLHPSGLFSPESFHQYYSSHYPKNTSSQSDATADTHATVPHTTSLYDLSQARLLQAAQETALVYTLTAEEFEARRVVVRYCQKFNEKALTQYLTYDPNLPMARLADMGALAVDGQTPLHVAARFNNLEALQLFEKLGHNVSFWVIDLQGRTPLHVAAEYQHDGVCAFLKAQMKAEMVAYHQARNGGDKAQAEAQAHSPVGVFAPVDLGGNTPLGCAKLSAKGKPRKEIEEVLFERGDRSVLPITPHEWRTGKSPWNKLGSVVPSSASTYYGSVMQTPYLNNATPYTPYTSYTQHTPHHTPFTPAINASILTPGGVVPNPTGTYGGGLLYAFSEAQGWTVRMEDRIVITCPLPGRPAWSLFMVCDGHGGTFVSNYLANHFPKVLSDLAINEDDGSNPPDDLDTTPEYLTSLLDQACLRVDKQLQDHPRMKVSRMAGSGEFVCRDSSGSTAVITLVTTHYVAIANVGDSRAVLAKRTSGTSASTSTTNGNPANEGSSEPGASNDQANGEATPVISSPVAATKRPSISRVTTGLQAVALSRDHKGRIPEEEARVRAAGANIELVSGQGEEAVHEVFTEKYVGRLRMTRSFGDFYLKQAPDLGPEEQAITAKPEVRIHARQSSDAFIVIACDGIWDVMSNDQVVEFVGSSLGYNVYGGPVGGITAQSLASVCDNLLAECLLRGSHDNMSAILLTLTPPSTNPSTLPIVPPTPSHDDNPNPSPNANLPNPGGSSRRRSLRPSSSDEIDVLHAFATPPDSSHKASRGRPLFDLLDEGNDDGEDDVQSPLNTKLGSSNNSHKQTDSVRKQLHFQ